jgi:two-component system response regulator NreC
LKEVTIALVEDHAIVRQGLRLLLEEDDRFQVLGECDDGLRALQVVRELDPDVVVMDLGLPGIGGLDVIREIVQHVPRTSIVVLSMHANEVHVREALRRGASAYVLKDAGAGQLIQAICEAAAGRRYLSPALPEELLDPCGPDPGPPTPERLDVLTLREKQVAHMVAEGLSAKEIANRLSISPRTVEIHRANAIRKLGVRNLAELVRVVHAHMQLPS